MKPTIKIIIPSVDDRTLSELLSGAKVEIAAAVARIQCIYPQLEFRIQEESLKFQTVRSVPLPSNSAYVTFPDGDSPLREGLRC